jgi:hypothetical protein
MRPKAIAAFQRTSAFVSCRVTIKAGVALEAAEPIFPKA